MTDMKQAARLASAVATVLALGCATTSSSSSGAAPRDPRAFFDHYVQLAKTFDAQLAELYSDDAVLTTARVMANGQQREQRVTGAQWKELLAKAMGDGQRLGDIDRFRDIAITETPEGSRITARRYSPLKCFDDDSYHMVVAPDPHGALRIVREHSTTLAQPQCGLGPDKPLAQRLEELAGQLAASLPLTLDDETSLERVVHDAGSLTYTFRLQNVRRGELPRLPDALSELAQKEVCAAPQLRPAIEAGATIHYDYLDRHDRHLHRATMTQRTCR